MTVACHDEGSRYSPTSPQRGWKQRRIMSGMGGLCIARAQELYDELKKFVKKCAASRNNSARLPRSWKTLRAFAYQGGSRKAPLARTTLGKVKIAEDWAISLPVPKSVMVAHGTASQTERESLDDDGLASQNRVKVQSGPFGNVGDKPCIQQLDPPKHQPYSSLCVSAPCVYHTWCRSTFGCHSPMPRELQRTFNDSHADVHTTDTRNGSMCSFCMGLTIPSCF